MSIRPTKLFLKKLLETTGCHKKNDLFLSMTKFYQMVTLTAFTDSERLIHKCQGHTDTEIELFPYLINTKFSLSSGIVSQSGMDKPERVSLCSGCKKCRHVQE